MYVTPKHAYTVRACEIIEGKCEGETVTLSGCELPRVLQEPAPVVWDCSEIVDPAMGKLCDILEAIQNQPIAAFDGDIALLGKCTEDGLPILVCKITDVETGEAVFQNHAPTGPNGTLEPYAGLCIDCADDDLSYAFNGEIVSDPLSPYWCEPVSICFLGGVPQGKFLCVGTPPTFQNIEDLSLSDTQLNVPGKDLSKKTFEGEVINFIVEHSVSAVTSIDDVIALAAAGGLPDLICKETGQTVPAAATDICAVKALRVPCNGSYVNDAGVEVTIADGLDDTLYVNNLSVNNSADDGFAGVDTQGPVLAGADAVSAWCLQFERCLTALEIAQLSNVLLVGGGIGPFNAIPGTPITPIDASTHFTDPDGEIQSYALSGDTLPLTLIFDPATGEISGTPDLGTDGAYNVVVSAVLDNGQTVDCPFALTVGAALGPSEFNAAFGALISNVQSAPFDGGQLQVTSDESFEVYTMDVSALPDGSAAQPAFREVDINDSGSLTFGFPGIDETNPVYLVSDIQNGEQFDYDPLFYQATQIFGGFLSAGPDDEIVSDGSGPGGLVVVCLQANPAAGLNLSSVGSLANMAGWQVSVTGRGFAVVTDLDVSGF